MNARRILGALVVLSAFAVIVSGASAAGFHGISLAENCVGTTKVGDPYTCTYQISNTIDTSHDTWHVTALSDTVFSSPPDTSSTILHDAQLVFSGAVTCVGGSGAGTTASPYVGATSCDMPFGTSITVFGNAALGTGFSFHTVSGADWASTAPSHVLTDQSTVTATDLCDFDQPPINCPVGPQTSTTGGQSQLVQRVSATSTTIHNAAHQAVTTVPVGSTVHDSGSVTTSDPSPIQPVPSGTVTINWFLNNGCTGAPAATTSVPLDAAGNFDATAFAFPVNSPGGRAFQASYSGDNTYAPSQGACEPLAVVDANIQITPAIAFNEIGTNHTLTGHVNVDTGAGNVNAPDGTVITFTFVSGSPPASFVGPSTCTTSGGTGSCTVVITSPTPVVANVRAATDVTVGGIVIHRETNGLGLNSGNAVKQFEDANIQITPANATNPVGTNHTLTGHVNVNDGTGFVNAPAGTTITFQILSGPGSFVGPSSCTTVGTTGSCTVVITSSTAGTTVIRDSTTVVVNGVSLTRSSGDGHVGDSADANKVWLSPDANIQISPAQATNEVRTNHTLTGHVNVSPDGVTFSNAPDGTVITFQILSGPGSFVGPSSCTTAGGTGSCTVVITSATAGVTVVRDSTTVTVNGVSLTRSSGDGHVGDSADANKTWVDANIQITPQTATNPVGTNHTLTGHVNVNPGTGFVNAPDGTVINFSLTNAGGATAVFVGPSSCTTAGGTGSCTVVISSPTAGTTTIHASTTVSVGGISLTRATADGLPGDSPDATKTWQANFEGCTPGFWKNHPDAWAGSGFSPNQTLGSVFTNTGRPNTTLIAALALKGGSSIQDAKDILLRAAVSSLLNSATLTFPFSTAQVISMVNAALASNDRATILALATQLDTANNAPCPLH